MQWMILCFLEFVSDSLLPCTLAKTAINHLDHSITEQDISNTYREMYGQFAYGYVDRVQIRCFFWSVFSRIGTLFTQWYGCYKKTSRCLYVNWLMWFLNRPGWISHWYLFQVGFNQQIAKAALQRYCQTKMFWKYTSNL